MISGIVAIDKHSLMGDSGKIPWHLPGDLKRFKEITMGHPIVMGRKTFDSIGRVLPGRKNIVLTRDKTFSHDDLVVKHSVDDIIKEIEGEEESFIIGGADIFKLFVPYIDKWYFTIIDHVFEGDVYMPEIDMSSFELIDDKTIEPTDDFPYSYRYVTYQKRA